MSAAARSAITRRNLLDAAATLIAEQGIDGFGLRDVGRVAGQRNNSVVHYHFGDKTGLVDAVLEDVWQELEAAYRDDADVDDPVGDPLRRWGRSEPGRRSVGVLVSLLGSPCWRHTVVASRRLDQLTAWMHERVDRSLPLDAVRAAWFTGLWELLGVELVANS